MGKKIYSAYFLSHYDNVTLLKKTIHISLRVNKLSPLKSFSAADVKLVENYALENLFLNFKFIKKELMELIKDFFFTFSFTISLFTTYVSLANCAYMINL